MLHRKLSFVVTFKCHVSSILEQSNYLRFQLHLKMLGMLSEE